MQIQAESLQENLKLNLKENGKRKNGTMNIRMLS